MQLDPLQHPAGQLAALQTQAPPMHAWPVPHAADAPHLHTPALHASDFVASQALQADPLFPQLIDVGGVTQTPLLQHPIAQLAEVHPLHAWLVHV